MERPLTIHGLQAKRCQLTRLHRQLEDEAAQLLKDIEHVDACLRLFDPEIQLKRVCFTRKHKNPPAPKGQLRRFILDQLAVAVLLRVVDAGRRVVGVQRVPVRSFVSVHDAVRLDLLNSDRLPK